MGRRSDRAPLGRGATAWVRRVCGMLLPAGAPNSMARQAPADVAPRILAEFGFDEPRYGWLALGFGCAFAVGALALLGAGGARAAGEGAALPALAPLVRVVDLDLGEETAVELADGGSRILPQIYYHSGLDIGGAEGLVTVTAATEGLVVSSGMLVHDAHATGTPVAPRGDVVYLRDARGWYDRYSHLQSIDPAVVPGRVLRMGDRIGVLGKEGASGGWSHLHFEIVARQPSGRWGTQAGYAILREAYLRDHRPSLIACARPRHFITAGESVVLDESRSWSAVGEIARFEWTLHDGTTAAGARVEKTYPRPGHSSEVLRVIAADGRVDHDFAIVQVLDPGRPDAYAPALHAAFAPSLGLRPGDPVTFKVRAFQTRTGAEVWDFGDGSPLVRTRSDGNRVPLAPDGYAVTTHTYRAAGRYVVRVERTSDDGTPAMAHLQVVVGE